MTCQEAIRLAQAACRELSVGEPAGSALCAASAVADELRPDYPFLAGALEQLVEAFDNLREPDDPPPSPLP